MTNTDLITKADAKHLAVAYNAYLEALKNLDGLQLNGANSVIVWGGVLLRAQDAAGLVLAPVESIKANIAIAYAEDAKSAAA